MTDDALFLKREKECVGTINIFKVSFGNLIYGVSGLGTV